MPVQNFVADLVRKGGRSVVLLVLIIMILAIMVIMMTIMKMRKIVMTFFCRILPGTSIALIFAALATKTNRCPKANCSLMVRMIMMSNLMMVMMI